MYCSKCGQQLRDDAQFCDVCGEKVVKDGNGNEKKESHTKEGKVSKCPYCGEVLPFDAVRCPSCEKEIRGRQVTLSVQSFFDKYSALGPADDEKKMELIKSFPIPNSREDIIDFLFYASSNFDAKYYATNKKKDSVPSAWLTKIDSCYQKGKALFSDSRDLKQIDDIYNKVHGEADKISKTRLIMIIGGIAGIIVGLGLIYAFQNVQAVSYVGLALIAIGTIALIIGAKRKKTNKEVETKKAEKARQGAPEKAFVHTEPIEKVIIKETTVIKHEPAEPKIVYVEKPTPSQASPIILEEKPPVDNHEEKPVSKITAEYPREEVEISPVFVLKQGEKIILKEEEVVINEDGKVYDLVLTNQALIYIQTRNERPVKVTRIPLCQVSQVIHHKSFLSGDIEIYREGATDKVEDCGRLALWEMAINDRFNSDTVKRDYGFYQSVKMKELKK